MSMNDIMPAISNVTQRVKFFGILFNPDMTKWVNHLNGSIFTNIKCDRTKYIDPPTQPTLLYILDILICKFFFLIIII